ncbi:hypothetical protein DPMN_127247 [Dreissena polymorpha]|uniref:Uncharacterized protein n=1 Tax=Dreissena polymorpha TaxID=45954 RepID=A0A9D4GYV5_DREPO|nr:hypothetical protein DPMN_127247 [Dreissena polymorpha]
MSDCCPAVMLIRRYATKPAKQVNATTVIVRAGLSVTVVGRPLAVKRSDFSDLKTVTS